MEDDNPRIFLKVVLVASIFVALGLYFVYPYLKPSQSFDAERIRALAAAKTIWETWVESDVRYNHADIQKDIHNVAGSLANDSKLKGLSMLASDWILPSDALAAEEFAGAKFLPKEILRPVNSLNGTIYLQSDFKRSPISWEFAVNVPENAPKSTPIMWSRGLQSDGTWDVEISPFSKDGGCVMYLDGRVLWYETLNNEDGGVLFKYGTREPTNNIEEAVFGGRKNILSFGSKNSE